MSYYPKSQIKTNLYTNGGEYSLSSNRGKYTGYYYEISSGEKYTGRTPQDGPNIKLIPITLDNEVDPTIPFVQSNLENLITLNNIVGRDQAKQFDFDTSFTPPPTLNLSPRLIPQFNLTLPTDQDKINGQFTRYFCKKNNEIKYLEINQDTFKKLQIRDSQIAWDLYTPVQVIWIISGNQTQVFASNKGTIQTIENTLQWTGFTQYFQDKFLKYYLGS
jgi:hypothetical protein